MRAISVTQHAAERNMILDALMPSAPVVVANPKAPPQGLMEAADSVRSLEQLRDTGYIGSDEYAKERQAIEMVMLPKQPEMVPAAPAALGGPPPAAAPAGTVGQLPAGRVVSGAASSALPSAPTRYPRAGRDASACPG